MASYFLRRLLLIIPTLFGILLVNFIVIQAAPGGPVDQMIAKIKGSAGDATARFSGSGPDFGSKSGGHGFEIGGESSYRGAQGLDPAFIKELEKMYGFDQPPATRFWRMIGNYMSFDLGKSYFKDRSVTDLILEKLPVSLSLGVWSTLIIYFISIPLGVAKAVRNSTSFDTWTSVIIVVGYAIPGFLFAILLIVLFAGGSFWDVFPLRGITSDNWSDLSVLGKITDYFWHMTLPVLSIVISGFASLTLLTKNSFLEEIRKNYVTTALAKGITQRRVLWNHVFRNGMLVVIAGLPAAFVQVFLTSSLLIEVIFSLDGLGLLSFDAALSRDYPVVFGTLFMFTLLGLCAHLLGDLAYHAVDPRIDFGTQKG